MLAGVAAWLWPIGLGGMMPVGGDVTQFSLGPMAVLSRSLRAGRLPLWNDLWGYGFPGVGESQMGVFYPPHWVLYGLLPLEAAYTASLVLHTAWGALGAAFAARRFGASPQGAALGGFAWAVCGFHAIHLPHQWGYTTGCWMPWAWGLAWSLARGDARPRGTLLLALVLAVQLLPGHFQLAFCTQVGVIVLATVPVVEGLVTGRAAAAAGARAGRVLVALGGAFVLAGAQVWPTLRLARLAATRRDFEYLSGFAATPLHLVSFLAPCLFGRSPLWRPLVWEPFHTSPEEYLGFIGLVPLFLALGAIGGGWRTSPAVRALAALGAVTLFLSLGPYVPGFGVWSQVPGFSFFRAPARWVLATSLALSCLAALGFDRLGDWRRPGRAVVRFAAAGVAVVAVVVGLVELAVAATERPGLPVVASAYSRVLAALPWGEPSVFPRVARDARRPNLDFRVQEAWARQGLPARPAPRPVFTERRGAIYRQELVGSAAVYLALLALAPFAKARWFRAALVVLTAADLGWVGRQRRLDVGPIAPLAAQSPVLARLATEPRATRTIDTLRNMPMVAAAAPVAAYRTLDLPALGPLTALAGHVPRNPGEAAAVAEALRATGAGVRILDPFDRLALRRDGVELPGAGVDVADPALAGWKFGTDWVARQDDWARTFRVVRLPGTPARGWRVALTPGRAGAILRDGPGDALRVLETLREAEPVAVALTGPGRREARFRAEGDALLVLSELFDPEWEAAWVEPGGDRPAEILRAFGTPNQGAWQAVRVVGTGPRTLRLVYRGRDVVRGIVVSGVGLVVLAATGLRPGGRRRREEG